MYNTFIIYSNVIIFREDTFQFSVNLNDTFYNNEKKNRIFIYIYTMLISFLHEVLFNAFLRYRLNEIYFIIIIIRVALIL